MCSGGRGREVGGVGAVRLDRERSGEPAADQVEVDEQAVVAAVDVGEQPAVRVAWLHVALEVQARDARIVVRDQGPGVPEYALGRAFEKFYSLPRPGGGKRSTGLGLAFVQEIASLHQGRASLVNAPEGGAIASLTLPRPAR